MSGGAISQFIEGQNKKYSISTMTKSIKDDFLAVFEEGVMGNGGSILAELSATPLASLSYDAYTDPDTTGRRWIPIQNIFLLDRPKAEKHTKNIIILRRNFAKSIWQKYLKKQDIQQFNKMYDNSDLFENIYDIMNNIGMSKSEINKIKAKVISGLIDKYEQYMKKHLKEFKTALNSNKKPDTFNEIIVNNYSIDNFYGVLTKEEWMDVEINNIDDLLKFRDEVKNKPVDIWNSPSTKTVFLEFCNGMNLVNKAKIPFALTTDEYESNDEKIKLWKTHLK